MTGELAVRRHDPEFLLACEGAFPVGVPAVVELAGVLVGPFLGDVMGGVGGTRAEVEVEGLVRVDLLGVGDELHRLVHQVRGEVVALFGCRRRIDLVVVVDQVGVPLAGVAAEESVEALEAPTERPAVVGPGGRLLTGRDQVPLAHHVGVVALREQDLGEEAVLERHVAVVTGEPGGELGDTRHRVGVVVAAREDARTTGRAQSSRVHVVVAQSVLRQLVEIRRLDRAAVAPELPESGVVEHDEDDVRRSLRRPCRGEPGRFRLVRGPSDHPGKLVTLLVFDDWHLDSSHLTRSVRLDASVYSAWPHRQGRMSLWFVNQWRPRQTYLPGAFPIGTFAPVSRTRMRHTRLLALNSGATVSRQPHDDVLWPSGT